jgi:hypothetical protein
MVMDRTINCIVCQVGAFSKQLSKLFKNQVFFTALTASSLRLAQYNFEIAGQNNAEIDIRL